jgi:Uma2 family endonuclease
MNEQVRITDPDVGFSADDFDRMIGEGAFEDMRVELVDGRIERMSPANGEHSEYNARVVVALARALDASVGIGTDLAIRIDDRTIRAADVAVIRGRFPAGIATSGDELLLVVEISDTTLVRDLSRKPEDYARIGVGEYWVVDLKARAIHVMTGCMADGYHDRAIVRFGEPLAVPGTDRTITID